MRAALAPVEAFLESAEQAFAPLTVSAWTLDEGLSRLYRCDCELTLDAAVVRQVASWLGERVVLRIVRGTAMRAVHGIVRRFEVLDGGSALHLVRLQIMPAIAVLEQQVHSRVYSERSLKELVQVLCDGPGLEAWKSCAAHHNDAHASAATGAGPAASPPAFERVVLDIVPTPTLALLQYQESIWAFVERTLAAWGLTYFFRHDNGAPCEQFVVVSDSRTLGQREDGAQPPPDAKHQAPQLVRHDVVASAQTLAASEGLSSLRWAREPEPKVVVAAHFIAESTTVVREAVTLGAHGYEQQLSETGTHAQYAATVGWHRLAYVVSPARWMGVYAANRFAQADSHAANPAGAAPEDGSASAPIDSCELYLQRAGEVHAWRQALRAHSDCGGTGNVLRLAAGDVLEVPSPRRAGYEAILITAVMHSATSEQEGAFEQSFAFVPLAVPFAAPVPPAPQVGLQMARVIGPPGSDVHVDRGGRVLVRLSFEQSDLHHESHGVWAELTQAWAGSQFGAYFFARVGSQVVVSLVDEGPGAPMLPVVMGSTYNEVQTPPVGTGSGQFMSGIRTRSTPNIKGGRYNELLFDDSYGTERVELRAQHTLRTWAGNDAELRVGAIHDPMHWGLRLALVALEHLAAFEYEVSQRSEALGDREVYEAATLGAGPKSSQPGGLADTRLIKGLRALRGQLALLRELTAALVARGAGLGSDIKQSTFVRRDYLRVCDLLSDFATSKTLDLSAETRTLVLETSRLMRIALAFAVQPAATYSSSVSGSHNHKVVGPTTETLVGGRHTTLGSKDKLGQVTSAALSGLWARLRRATYDLPASEWRRSSKYTRPHTPLEKTVVYGASKREVFDDSTLVTHGHSSDTVLCGSKRTVHGDSADAVRGRRRTHTQGDNARKVSQNDSLRVKKTAQWSVRRLVLTVFESMRVSITHGLHMLTHKTLHLQSREHMTLQSAHNLNVSATRRARVDGKLVTLTGHHAVKLEQGGASITIRDGNITLSGKKIVIRGLQSVDIRSINTQLH